MKKHITDLLATSLAWLSIMSVTSCSNDDAADVNHLLEVKSVLPTKVMEGQVITITGTGLDKVTSVVFPGNVAVNNISKVAAISPSQPLPASQLRAAPSRLKQTANRQ